MWNEPSNMRPEIMRQPEIGLRHQEFGIALQPVAVGAVEAEGERGGGGVRRDAAARQRGHDRGHAFIRRDGAVLVEVDAEHG